MRSIRRRWAVVRWLCSAGDEVAGVFRRRWLSLRSMTPSSFWTRWSTIQMLVRHRLLRAACLFRSVDSAIISALSSLRRRMWLGRPLLNGYRPLRCSRVTCAGAWLQFAPTLVRLAALCCCARYRIRFRRGLPLTPRGCLCARARCSGRQRALRSRFQSGPWLCGESQSRRTMSRRALCLGLLRPALAFQSRLGWSRAGMLSRGSSASRGASTIMVKCSRPMATLTDPSVPSACTWPWQRRSALSRRSCLRQ